MALPAQLLTDSAAGDSALATLLLAHGAGAPMDSGFMNQLTAALKQAGVSVIRFEFPYMQWSRKTGRRRPPDPQPVLLQYWRDLYRQVAADAALVGPLLIGGKSMGGRMASMVADELGVAGLCCFGYPFHAPGRPAELRTGHLYGLQTPGLILQGTRDPFGTPQELAAQPLSGALTVHWLESGDHDFRPTRASGLTKQTLLTQAATATVKFIAGLGSDRHDR